MFIFLLSPLAQAEVLRDPTLPLEGVAGSAKAPQERGLPKLQSIMLGNGPARAVLNGQSYRIGERVNGYQLVGIDADAVLLDKGGKRLRLPLFAGGIVQ
ncbi:SctD/MshK family protein [Aeromonas sobria]|uniref:SctD/MshK family protein n=1 Tax=Aeromonas sobria TaxID=646 RepID=UPI003CFDFCD5